MRAQIPDRKSNFVLFVWKASAIYTHIDIEVARSLTASQLRETRAEWDSRVIELAYSVYARVCVHYFASMLRMQARAREVCVCVILWVGEGGVRDRFNIIRVKTRCPLLRARREYDFATGKFD